MASKMLTFVSVGREMPEKRPASGRRRDFAEIYARFDPDQAAAQAGRCSQCGVPFCQVHCPVQNNIPDWLKLTAEGRLEEAYEVSAATNNFPEICGRICPQDRLCEGNCVIEQAGHGTVTIGAVEKYITDTAWEQGWVKPVEARARADAIASASSAPGRPGLPRPSSCAARAIAGHRLRPLRPRRRADDLRHSQFQAREGGRSRAARSFCATRGIEFQLNTEIGRDLALRRAARARMTRC